ncbi:hypothetical protein ACTG16_22305 [Aeromonas sp. 23P]|uniref:hypothetical protein n=1 Tax=Aeromonas sp. 23P TaxID=3452716 RepID=UPI003F7A9753|nr:hypothetical protein [Aeromonas veronii]
MSRQDKITKVVKKRDCQICGDEQAVGKYYVSRDESENHGWWRVCEFCAETVEGVGANVDYYRYYKGHLRLPPSLPEQVLNCHHDWAKWSLVSEMDKKRNMLFDWMKCGSCGCYGKRFSMSQAEMDDITMEIDLNCSR